jgi:hypothetical protein
MLEDKLTKEIAEAAKKVMQREVEEPRAKGEKDFKAAHKVDKKADPEQDPKNYKFKMSEGKMKDLHGLIAKGIKDPKKIMKSLKLPDTPEVTKAIASLIKGMKVEGLDPVNKKAVVKQFTKRKDKDIDNDGDVDDSDEYLHKKRQAISKATKDEDKKKLESANFSEFNLEPTSTELDEACEFVLEHGDITDLSDEQLDEVVKTVATAIGKGIGSAAKKVANRLSTSGRADAAEKRADKVDKRIADKQRLSKAKDRIRKAKEDQRADKEKERKARDSEKKAAQQDRDDSRNEMYDPKKDHTKDPKSHIKFNKETKMYCVYDMKGKKVAEFKTKEEAEKYAVKNHDSLMKESVNLEEKNDALYLIYKDKIKAMQVRNFIKKTYRNSSEVEMAPMDKKNFGVSVFSDRGDAKKIKTAVDKKFGKPDDFMLENIGVKDGRRVVVKALTKPAALRLQKKLRNKFSSITFNVDKSGLSIIVPNEKPITRYLQKQPEVDKIGE